MDYQPAVLGSLDDHDHLLTLASGAIGLARQAGITEKVLPMQAHLITVADLPGLLGAP
jgi:hypothetical protein